MTSLLKRCTLRRVAFVSVCLTFASGETAAASTYEVVAEIGTKNQVGGVIGGLVLDSKGNIYGEFSSGYGAVFELTAKSGYGKVNTIYDFGTPSALLGIGPEGGVTFTPHNTILATTDGGGAYYDGTVLDLGKPDAIAPASLHDFHGAEIPPTDGQQEASGVTLGYAGHYYGTTPFGGFKANNTNPDSGGGTLYQVVADPSDSKYRVLHRFGFGTDGTTPTTARLAIEPQGQMFGVTIAGGANNTGTVYMMQMVGGVWQEQVIHSFGVGDNLNYPVGNVVLDEAGNLYGCAPGGTHNNQGAIFRLAPPAQPGGAWIETILYNFGDQRNDPEIVGGLGAGGIGAGCYLTLDQTTNLIVGTTPQGGFHDQGTLFVLAPPAAGQTAWAETVGYSFGQSRLGVSQPLSPPLQVGNTYYGGGSSSKGIYAFTP
jgi:hypothetical protein